MYFPLDSERVTTHFSCRCVEMKDLKINEQTGIVTSLEKGGKIMTVITISRQFGSGGTEIATQVCKELGYQYFEKRLMDRIAADMGLVEQEVIDFSEDKYQAKGILERLFKSKSNMMEVGAWAQSTTGAWTKVSQKIGEQESVVFVNNLILAASKKGNVVIVGRGGQAVLKDTPGVLHVRLIAPLDNRIQRVQAREHLTEEEARKMVEKRDHAIADYLKRFHNIEVSDPTLYHLVLNSGKWDVETIVKIIVNAARENPSTNVSA
ncbi:putative cytidylate kinase, putative [Candidatus Vecturithrix granuli]|uniref:Putative cytidylate kinase, putative n=1 Tax=Vecturithrix granuli TaxID=1499967 RepID=A0A081BVC1_VECG1|nr:putative cytidylate kinase, putative [Candidatus Vecturithrix granuli]